MRPIATTFVCAITLVAAAACERNSGGGTKMAITVGDRDETFANPKVTVAEMGGTGNSAVTITGESSAGQPAFHAALVVAARSVPELEGMSPRVDLAGSNAALARLDDAPVWFDAGGKRYQGQTVAFDFRLRGPKMVTVGIDGTFLELEPGAAIGVPVKIATKFTIPAADGRMPLARRGRGPSPSPHTTPAARQCVGFLPGALS